MEFIAGRLTLHESCWGWVHSTVNVHSRVKHGPTRCMLRFSCSSKKIIIVFFYLSIYSDPTDEDVTPFTSVSSIGHPFLWGV